MHIGHCHKRGRENRGEPVHPLVLMGGLRHLYLVLSDWYAEELK